jgi:hypothetical protein
MIPQLVSSLILEMIEVGVDGERRGKLRGKLIFVSAEKLAAS